MFRLAAAIATLFAAPALASQCIQLAGDPTARIWQASLAPGEVRIVYVDHSAFRIETDQGRVAVTDYYGSAGPGKTPDAVTMNHAHSSHWTPFPDPDIQNVLKGWGDGETPADHWVELDDLLIRNVPTDIRSFSGGTEAFGNSIFIFAYEGLCIGHLGHLHHVPTESHFGRIGRLDVVMAPVDGGMTLPIKDMLTVVNRLKSRIVIPMHAFSSFSLAEFIKGLSSDFKVDLEPKTELVISAATLPAEPTLMILSPQGFGPGFGDD